MGVAHTGMDLGGLESNCNPRAPLPSRPTRSPESRFLCTFVGWTRREFDISSRRAEGLGGAVVRGRWREDAEMGVGVEWEWECEYRLLVLPCPITWNFALASSIDDQPRAPRHASLTPACVAGAPRFDCLGIIREVHHLASSRLDWTSRSGRNTLRQTQKPPRPEGSMGGASVRGALVATRSCSRQEMTDHSL